MKKTVLALAVLGAMSGMAHAQSNVVVYGRVDAGVSHVTKEATGTETGSRTGVDSGLLSASRFGIRGTEDLGNGLNAAFTLEGGIALDNGGSTQGGLLFGRKSTVGLTGKSFGTLDIGRRKDFTDEVAGAYASIGPFGTFTTRVHANNLDRVGGNRANNMIYYSTPTFGGFRANVSYGFGESADDSSIGQSWGFGANYDAGAFGIGFGYWQSKRGTDAAITASNSDQGASSGAGCKTAALGDPGDTCIKTWMLGSKYKLGNLTLRGTYSEVEQPLITAAGAAAPDFTTFTAATGTAAFTAGGANNDEARIVDLGVDYDMGAWKLKASIIQSRYNFIGATQDGKLTQGLIGAEYHLSKRTRAYTTFAHMKASDMYSPGIIGSTSGPGADNSTSAMGVGILHLF